MMAETQKKAFLTANSKEKNSLLDVDFGKDFLSSWNSMAVAEDDAMDFDFGTVAKGKKKAFSFDKLDVDFSLDEDLGRISSFKVDVSDLDISSPPKNAGTRERSKAESSSGNHQRKQDCFSFPFDFNELDSFGFESSSRKEGNNSSKNKDSEEAPNRSECQGPRTEQSVDISASERANPKFAASGVLTISTVETAACDYGKCDSTDHSGPLDLRVEENGPSIQNPVEFGETTTLPETMSNTSAQVDISGKSVSEDQTVQYAVSELQVEVGSPVTIEAIEEQNVELESPACLGLEGSLFEKSDQSVAKSCSDDGERNIYRADSNISEGKNDDTEPAQGDTDSEDTSSTSASRKSMCESEDNREHRDKNSEIQLTSPNSGTSKLIQKTERETGIVRSRFFKRSDEKESQIQKMPASRTMPTIFPGKTSGSKKQTDEGRDHAELKDAQGGNKLVSISNSHSGELTKHETVQPESLITGRDPKDTGECIIAGGLLNGSKLAGSSSLSNGEITKGEPLRELGKDAKNLITLSTSFKPYSATEQKTNKFTTQNPAILRTVLSTISIKNSLKVSGEGNNGSTVKANRSLPDLSGLKISRNLGMNDYPSNSTFQKQTKSSRNVEQKVELERNTPPKISPTVSIEMQSESSQSLKRKTFETPNVDALNIKLLKRFSPSPTESRTVKELSGGVIEEEVRNHVKLAESISCQTSALDFSPDVTFTDLKMPLGIETDDNVEKAEAYTKDLEDIRIMLKKKHEEAKELLVRTVVNNNNLLMLNHPIHEEKIRKVQKFAAQLMSKEVHA